MPTDSGDKKAVAKFDKATVKRAEKLIDSSPELKKIRDISNGLTQRSGVSIGGGDPKYAEGWERIFGKKKKDEEE